jgi:hypothetical protein
MRGVFVSFDLFRVDSLRFFVVIPFSHDTHPSSKAKEESEKQD